MTDGRPLSATLDLDATPEEVWRVVGDVRRTGEWSPECRRVRPFGPVHRGALLLGLNRRGRVRWATLSRVVEHEPVAAIGWRVLTNRSEWRYQLDPRPGGGTRITQTRRTPRGVGRGAALFTAAFLGGGADHDDELERGMAAGLERIRAIVDRERDGANGARVTAVTGR